MTSDIVQASFDYGMLDAETRIVVQQRTGEIKTLVRKSAQDIIDIGAKLLEVKTRLGHGQFAGWLRSEFEWSQDTAGRFMQVAQRFGQIPQIAEFAPSALYLLASPSTPDAAVEDALTRAAAGEAISRATAQEIVQEHKPAAPQYVPAWKLHSLVYEFTRQHMWNSEMLRDAARNQRNDPHFLVLEAALTVEYRRADLVKVLDALADEEEAQAIARQQEAEWIDLPLQPTGKDLGYKVQWKPGGEGWRVVAPDGTIAQSGLNSLSQSIALIHQLAAQLEEKAPGTSEACAPQMQSAYVTVAQLEDVVRATAAHWYRAYDTRYKYSDMRSAAKTRDGGAFWRACVRAMPADIGKWRGDDLAQAINNVVGQMEAQQPATTPAEVFAPNGNSRPAPQPAPQKPAAWDGVTAHTWDGYADWDDVDQAEYAALAPTWRLPRNEFNDLAGAKQITRWRVAARLASERPDNLSWSLQDIARRLRLRAQIADRDDAWRADIARRQASAVEAERKPEPAPVAEATADAAEPQAEPAPVAEVADFELFAAAERAYLGDLKPGQMRRPFQWGDGYWVSVGGVYSPGTAPGEFDGQHCVRVHPDGEPIAPGMRIGWYRSDAYLPGTELHLGSAAWRMGAQWLVVKRAGQRYQPAAEPEPLQAETPAPQVDEFHTLAAERKIRLITVKRQLTATLAMLPEFGDLTGRHTASLLAGRELGNMVEILDGELDALQRIEVEG